MSLPINISSAVTVNLASYSGATGVSINGTTSNGANSSANTSSYVSFTGSTRNTTGYAYYVFDTLSIPTNATVNSVSCVARAGVSSTSRGTAGLQLMANDTAKGSETTFTVTTAQTSNQTVSLTNNGTWTVSELNGTVKLRIRVSRGQNSFYVRFYGATLTVNYTVNGTAYEVNVTNNSVATVSPTYDSGMTGEDITISFSGIQDKAEIVVLDNNVDVTNSLTVPAGGSGIGNFIPSEYVSSASTYASVYTGSTSDGLADSGSTSRFCVYSNTGSGAISKLTYKFNCSSIPQNATITNVTCVAGAACYSSGSYFATRTLQLYNGSTAKGTATTITGNGGTKTNHTIDGGSWTRSELNDIALVLYITRTTSNVNEDASFSFWGASLAISYTLPGDGFEYTISNISADHTVVVSDNASLVKYTVSGTSSYAGATMSPSTQQVIEGRSATVEFEVDHLYEIVVKDNGTVVTPTEPVTSTTVSFIPDSYVASASTATTGTTYPPSNGLANTASTNYAAFSAQTGANAIVDAVYTFDCSSIPQGAIIDSVSCAINARVSNATYLPTSYAQLYHGSTAKGSQSANINATQSTRTFEGGNWTREELNDISMHYIGQRGTSSTTSGAALRLYGANLSITYHVPCSYTITNVQTNHTITIEEAPYYTISTASTYAGASASISPAKLYSGLDANITLSVTNLYEVKVKLDGTDITSNFVGSNGTYTYTLQNVTTNHALTIEEAPYYTITVNNSYQDVDVIVDPPKGYYGIDVDIRFEVDDIDEIKVLDNGVNVIANIISVSPGLYRYTINAINTNHTVTVTESTRYGVTASSTYNLVTIEPTSASVIEGHSQTFIINGDPDVDFEADIRVTDNNVDVTSQVVLVTADTSENLSYALGSFDDVNSDYVGIYNNYVATNAEGTTAEAGAASSASTRSSFYPASGEGSELFVYYNFNVSGIPEDAIISNVSCQAAVGVAYNGSGYSETDLQLCVGTTPKGEATTVNKQSAATIYDVDGGSGWTRADLANVKILMHGVRNSTNSNNDATGQRDNMNICGASLIVTYGYPAGCSYTITNVQTSHTIVVSEVPATYYPVNASSTYNQATVTPATQSIRQNHTARVQISASSIYDIVVRDNDVNVTSELVPNETGFTYTITRIVTSHTIVVAESESFTITTSSQYQDATISPATQTVRQGMSAITYIEVSSVDEISVKDNDVEVGDQLVLVSAGTEYQATGVLGTFDDTNSDYVGIYSSYVATNAEGKSSAEALASTGSTRSSFYPHSGVGSELSIYYDFGEVTGIPSNSVITNVSAVVVAGGAYSGQGYSEMTVQLCKGTTPVGSPSDIISGTSAASAVNVDGGSGWTLSDISNAKVLMHGVRNSTNSDSSNPETRDNLNICGADLVVTYTDGESFNGYTYTLTNIQTAHTIVITENPQYTLTSSSNVQGVTITPASITVYGRQSAIFNISGDISEAVVLDNNIDVTTQVRSNSTGATYTVTNVQTAHTIVISEPSSESDYIKIAGQFKKVLGYYRRVNGVWTLIEKSAFDTQVSTQIAIYGGVIESSVIGEVESSGGAINITINDDTLDSGTYRMVYEDASKSPITGYTDINSFTIQ